MKLYWKYFQIMGKKILNPGRPAVSLSLAAGFAHVIAFAIVRAVA